MTKYIDSENLRSLLAVAIVNLRSPLSIDAIPQAHTNQIAVKDSQENSPAVLFFRMNLGTILGKHRGELLTCSNLENLVDIAAMLLQAEIKLETGIETEAKKNFLANAIQWERVPMLCQQIDFQDVTTGDCSIHAACRVHHDQELELYKKVKMRNVAYYFSHSNRTLRHVICDYSINENEETGYTRLSSMPIQETSKDNFNCQRRVC